MSTFFIENRQGRHEHTFYRGARKTYRKTLPNGDPLPFEGKPICAYTVESETTIFKFWIWPETDQDFKLHPDDVAEIHPQYVRFRTGRVFRGRGEYVLCDPGEGV
ncbi:MAG: hypothetical protein EOM20_12220, partial [Spartobacteria bacterium]|nr:hypothetical protein [Spartobacteria bacterium]